MSSPVNPLAGTSWRLVEFQSMDDATGTVHPDDPSLYTMRLNSDGTVTMRLNCNRASGTWYAEPSGNVSSGRFEFGPLGGTRALCPPPSLDEKIVAQAKFIRSYLLKDGKLYLNLMADGGRKHRVGPIIINHQVPGKVPPRLLSQFRLGF